jgi:hypothetical protein
MEQSNNNRTITICAKVTPNEKIRYTKIAKSHGISISEWIASILNMYQDGYGELKINPVRENELLNEIANLKQKVIQLDAILDIKNSIIEIEKKGFNKS